MVRFTKYFYLDWIFSLFIFGLIGFIDDYNKIKSSSSNGLKARTRITLQLFFALIISLQLLIILMIKLILQ